ncbi:MAG: hypothetical protein ACK4RN_17200, partial [Pseudorhodobacter sp.]
RDQNCRGLKEIIQNTAGHGEKNRNVSAQNQWYGGCSGRTMSPGAATRPEAPPAPQPVQDPLERELHEQIKAAPSSNRQFHASDLCRVIGQAVYDARVVAVIQQFG